VLRLPDKTSNIETGGQKPIPPPPKFYTVRKFSSCLKIFIQKFIGGCPPFWGEFSGKNEILNTYF